MSFNTVEYANQLLTENERLKQQVKQLGSENALMLADYRDIPEMRRIGKPTTPATDAWLNEVRAQGAESFGKHTIAIGESESDQDIIYAGKQALLFAAQLRAGEVSNG